MARRVHRDLTPVAALVTPAPPIVLGAERQAGDGPARRVHGRGIGQVALVEDDPTVRRALQRILRTMDFDVSAFASAEEFLMSSHLNETACLVSDIQMQGMSVLIL